MTGELGAWAGAGLSISALIAWVWLTLFRGRFWATDQRLDTYAIAQRDSVWPGVVAVIPARDEADLIGRNHCVGPRPERYPGPILRLPCLMIEARMERRMWREKAAQQVNGCPLLPGGNGEGEARRLGGQRSGPCTRAMEAASGKDHDYFWFTDADIVHSPDVLTGLVARAEVEGLDLVSVMARLHVSTFWDRLLIPAFVFFFGKLYPFRWVNDHGRGTAAAAGWLRAGQEGTAYSRPGDLPKL